MKFTHAYVKSRKSRRWLKVKENSKMHTKRKNASKRSLKSGFYCLKKVKSPPFSSVTSHTSFVSHQTDSNCTGADADGKNHKKKKKKPKKKPEVLNRPHRED